MISTKLMKKRRIKLVILALSFVLILFLAHFIDGSYEHYRPLADELSIVKSSRIPLREISGLQLRMDRGDRDEATLLSIGDRFATIAKSVVDLKDLEMHSTDLIDFSKPILDRFSVCSSDHIPGCKKHYESISSQWEAIASDSSGDIFLLHEQLATVIVYDPAKRRINSVINFESFDAGGPGSRGRKRSTLKSGNALGEGIILLANGHILVIKEREEPTLYEFGLAGETASGYSSDLHLGETGQFPKLGDKVSMIPLKRWRLPSNLRSCDLSELTADKEGSLFLLSQNCQWISKVALPGVDQIELAVVKQWHLPRKLRRAEALAVLQEGRFIVAQDHKSQSKENLFFLQ